MWAKNWRNEVWSRLDQPWDIVIIGGGITGAGIFREAARLKLKVLLVEQRDFAWGASSRSSKFIHGGLRYLKEGNLHLTWTSVHEREQLLRTGAGLVKPIGFLLPVYKGAKLGRWTYSLALALYDRMGTKFKHRYYKPYQFELFAPRITTRDLKGGFSYYDAQTDDARLTLRLILEGVADGGAAINYVAAEDVLQENGQVVGLRLHDQAAERRVDVRARVVINATGAWADGMRSRIGASAHLRPLRGSHLVFPRHRLPVAQSISCEHPVDGRHVSIFPWETVTIVGTTDLDHDQPLHDEPVISPDEVAYLMQAADHLFPSLHLDLDDVIGAWAGVRPVVGTGKADPSKESRESVLWQENGLLTVTGGKLTTFRATALTVLRAVRGRLPAAPSSARRLPVLNPVCDDLPGLLDNETGLRLLGRYGAAAKELVAAASPDELEAIPGTKMLWAELRWAAHAEGVVHLDDLLLRRVRIGLILPKGGESLLPSIRSICQPELGWDNERWEAESAAYLSLWRKGYSLPDRALIPDWRRAR